MEVQKSSYRLAVALTLGTIFLLIWLSLGVGIIGRDGDPANIMYFGVLAVGLILGAVGRFRPLGLSRALIAMAVAQAVVALIALASGLGQPWSGPLELSALNGFFIALFLLAAWLFRRSANEEDR